MIGFQLWREYKLSIAEILAVFSTAKVIAHNMDILIVDNISQEEVLHYADFLWGTIKIMEIFESDCISYPVEDKINEIAETMEWKFRYGLSVLWEKRNIKTILMKVKKSLKEAWKSSRFVNKDFKSLSSAQIIGENLVKRATDFSLICAPLCNTKQHIEFFWITMWVQNINEYSKRDYAKSRDMQIGMLPPKLSQIMINVSLPLMQSSDKNIKSSIYDPFVWLWTILIEAQRMWFSELYGSDLNEKMVETAKNNVSDITQVEKLNAKFVHEVPFWKNVQSWIIITEWYLWEIMTQKNISISRIKDQRDSLVKIYTGFFASLKKWNFSWTLVISFPYWEMKWKYFYFEEIYSLLEEYCTIVPYFSENSWIVATKKGSLLYKRDKQLVWREIFRLQLK